MILRDATAKDAPALGAILTAWVAETPWMPRLHGADEDADFIAGKISTALVRVVARRANAPLGFLVQEEGYVACLYLAPGARGQGLGAALLGEAQARSDRLSLWTFAQNTGARRFYARHGFAQTRATEGDNDEGLPDVELTWTKDAR